MLHDEDEMVLEMQQRFIEQKNGTMFLQAKALREAQVAHDAVLRGARGDLVRQKCFEGKGTGLG